jgi:hypothetical protein
LVALDRSLIPTARYQGLRVRDLRPASRLKADEQKETKDASKATCLNLFFEFQSNSEQG